MSNDFVVVRAGGKQYIAHASDSLNIDGRLDPKKQLEVLLYSDQANLYLGHPVLSDVKIKSTVQDIKKGKKILVQKFKHKSRYSLTKGFRPYITQLKIDKIDLVKTRNNSALSD